MALGSSRRNSAIKPVCSVGFWRSGFLHRPCLCFFIMTHFLNKRGFSSRSSADKAAIIFQWGWLFIFVTAVKAATG